MPDPEPTPLDSTRLLGRILLSAVLLVLLVRLAGFVLAFGNDSLQMDLASFYAAGQAVDRGLSPYVNHVAVEPPVWDGVAGFAHSRFLYPPLAARLFQPLAWLPYPAVKMLWMLLTLGALGVALALAARSLRPAASLGEGLVLAVVAAWFYPVLTLLERGQVDAFTLLLVVSAVVAMRNERRPLVAGALLALATLVKLHVVYLVPFLLLRRRFQVVAGYAVCGVVLLAVSVAVDGYGPLRDYATAELPRIAEHGEGGTRAMALPAERFRPLLHGVEHGRTVLDGRSYAPAYFRFVLNGSLAQTAFLRAAGVKPAVASLGLLAALLAATFVCLRRWGPPVAHGDGEDDLVYWLLAMTGILLVSPVSWAMGAVWLLPLVPLVVRDAVRPRGTLHVAALGACSLGLILSGAPDPYGFEMLSPFGERALNLKYVVGEALCLVGLFGLWLIRAAGRFDRAGR